MSSSRRRSTSSSSSSNGREEESEELMLKLQELISQLKFHGSNRKLSAETLKEACKHIKRLRREVEKLSSTLSHLLMNNTNDIDDVIRSYN